MVAPTMLSFLLHLPEGHRQRGHGQSQEDGHGNEGGGIGAEGIVDHAPAGGGREGGHGAAADAQDPAPAAALPLSVLVYFSVAYPVRLWHNRQRTF